jgi:citrate lyase subunit beta / citryl-CoA lyase
LLWAFLNLLRRSQLFVPANEEKKIRKSVSFEADSIIFDLEDSVPDGAKAGARDLLSSMLEELDWGARELCVRVNRTAEGYSAEDLSAVAKMEKINSIILPKIELESSWVFERTGKQIIALIETARGLVRLRDIAESKGLVAISFGPQDYANSVSGNVIAYSSNLYVRTAIVAAARANDLDPIDGVYFDLADLAGFRAEAISARELGYSGKQVVHPSQISVANEVFSPNEEELLEARRIVAIYENASKERTGALRVNDRLVDAVHYRRAKDILEKSKGERSS